MHKLQYRRQQLQTAVSVGFVEDKAFPGIASGLPFSCLSKCCQMLLEFTHHTCITKRNKYPELSPYVSEVPSSALLGNGFVWDGSRQGCGWASASPAIASLLSCSRAGSGMGRRCLLLQGMLGMKRACSVFWGDFWMGCLDSANVYMFPVQYGRPWSCRPSLIFSESSVLQSWSGGSRHQSVTPVSCLCFLNIYFPWPHFQEK